MNDPTHPTQTPASDAAQAMFEAMFAEDHVPMIDTTLPGRRLAGQAVRSPR